MATDGNLYEEIKISVGVSGDNLTQTDKVVTIEQGERTVLFSVVNNLSQHYHVIRKQDIADGAVALQAPGAGAGYLYLRVSNTVVLDFTQNGGARQLRVCDNILLSCGDMGIDMLTNITVTATVDDTEVRAITAMG